MNFIKSSSILRQTLKGTKYLLSNPQVGAFVVTTKDGKADFTDIAVNLLTGIGKALIAYWAGVAIVAGTLALFTGVALPALAVFTIGATVSILTGAIMNWMDDKYEWTTSLQEKINELQESFNKKIEQIEEDVDNTIYKFFQDLEREFWNWVSANGGAAPYGYGIRY
jgi:ABC-type multidrug transport system fused ATPase/permease subunit